jgi:hypothetical protein
MLIECWKRSSATALTDHAHQVIPEALIESLGEPKRCQLQRCICAVEHAFMPSAYLPFTGSALTCASSGCPVQSLRARLAFEGTSIEPAVTSKQLRRRGLALVDWCPSAIRSPRHADARPPLAVIAFDFVGTCCFDDALGRRKPEMR